jgi:hypothetical protein
MEVEANKISINSDVNLDCENINQKEDKILENQYDKILEENLIISNNDRSKLIFSDNNEQLLLNKQKENPIYKILSVDGAGTKCIIPGIILSEIEKETKQPISKLFNMQAGTSNSAVITCCLTIPDDYNSRRPKYSAEEIVKLFREKSYDLFIGSLETTDNNLFYSDSGHKFFFNKYFGKMKLSQGLKDIFVPTISTICTRLIDQYFTNLQNIQNLDFPGDNKDELFYDVVMSATATYSYYRSHLITYKKDIFIDGNIHLSNPSRFAFLTARHNHIKIINEFEKRYFVFSLGTGTYTDRGFFSFFKNKNDQDHITEQQVMTDYIMETSFKDTQNKYIRMQPTLYKNYKWDDFKSIPEFEQITYEFIDELKNSDDNKFNKLLEYLDIENKCF